MRVADAFQRERAAFGAREPFEPPAPVSIVLIVVATSSTWPNSSAAMLRDEVEKRTSALAVTEVEGLEGVVQERRHLSELAAQQLLHRGRTGGIGVGRRRQLGENTVDTANHCLASNSWRGRRCFDDDSRR